MYIEHRLCSNNKKNRVKQASQHPLTAGTRNIRNGMRMQRLFIQEHMSKMKGAIVVNTDRCKGCQLCVVACPQDVIALAQKKVNVHGYPYVEPANADKCVGCASCAIVCPDGCITVYRKKMEE